ncbi:zinc-binding dehydrogenase (plasmid) [Streptomyces sp. NBC_01334]|nr:zinc-binding dehydrogenase [Streptomyces sp. NBC_01334]
MIWETLAGMAVADGITFPIDSVYPLDEVRAAYIRLGEPHTRGKIVLAFGDTVPLRRI